MTRILIAEDSATQRTEIEFLLEEAGYEVASSANGALAWELIERSAPDVILTDLHMPEMNGLELVEKVREHAPSIPVILITADGSEEIAVEALRKGAASYIPKQFLDRDLLSTVSDIVKMVSRDQNRQRLVQALQHSQHEFEFGNDYDMASSLIVHTEEELSRVAFTDETGIFRISMALKEALINAIDHGNLELDSALKDDDENSYREMSQKRMREEPYCDRRVRVRTQFAQDQVSFQIRDEGPGFNPSAIPDPTTPDNLIRAHGRGLMLIHSFMDQVTHNDVGNETTMTKFREPDDRLL